MGDVVAAWQCDADVQGGRVGGGAALAGGISVIAGVLNGNCEWGGNRGI